MFSSYPIPQRISALVRQRVINFKHAKVLELVQYTYTQLYVTYITDIPTRGTAKSKQSNIKKMEIIKTLRTKNFEKDA